MKTRIRLAILLVFSVALLTAAAAQQFISAPQYPVGGQPWRVVTADFNGDGNPDLAVGSNSPLGQISILLGNGDGTFRRGQQFQKLDQSSWGLAVGDWNGDGVLDLASADQSYGAVRIYLGIGDGSFTRGDEYAMSKEDPSGISAGDLNGDGVLDLVTANYFGSLSVLLGKGDGTFAVAVDYPLTGFQGNDVVVGDLNKDGNLDVVGAFNTKSSFQGFLQVYLGNGDGTLRAPTAYSNGDGSNGVALGDLNGDGIVDLCASSSGLVVLFGNGDGSFAPGQYYPGLLLSFTSAAAADLNGDGRLDVVQSTAAVWQNRGDGTFLAPVYYGIGVAPVGLAVGDFNRDGDADVAIADAFTQTVSVLLNTGAGKLMAQRLYNVGFTGDTYPQGLAAGYIDRDKVLDFAVTDEYGARVLVLPGNPDGSFRPAKSFGTGLYPNQVALADVDGDGWTDIVTANGANSISVLRGNGIGDFAKHVEYASGLDPYVLVIGDFDNDGTPDVVTGNYTAHGVSALLNDGSGAFPKHIDTYTGSRVVAIAAGDFNKDGNLDIATANDDRIQGSFSVLLGNGDGTFVIHETNFRSTGSSVAISDVNADGNADLVLLGSLITVYPGHGDGTFGSPITSEGKAGQGLLGDFNGDGKLDAAQVYGYPPYVYLLIGNGDGTFQSPQQYATVESSAIASGDFNRDGTLDVAVSGGCCISVLLNSKP